MAKDGYDGATEAQIHMGTLKDIAGICEASGKTKTIISGVFTVMARMGTSAYNAFTAQAKEIAELRQEIRDLRRHDARPPRTP